MSTLAIGGATILAAMSILEHADEKRVAFLLFSEERVASPFPLFRAEKG
jgi:hypothetical protein